MHSGNGTTRPASEAFLDILRQRVTPQQFETWFRKIRLDESDDVDILGKVAFDFSRVPTRRDRVDRFWDHESRRVFRREPGPDWRWLPCE